MGDHRCYRCGDRFGNLSALQSHVDLCVKNSLFVSAMPRKNGKNLFDPSRMVQAGANPDGFTYMGEEYFFDFRTQAFTNAEGSRWFTKEQVHQLKSGFFVDPVPRETNDEAVIDYLAEQARRLA